MADLLDLAREAVAPPEWRWMQGMHLRCPGLPGSCRVTVSAPRQSFWLDEGWLPDLDDAATLGCLLALVREAWGEPHLVAIYCEAANPGQSEGWGVQTADNRLPIDGVGDHPTEAHALVAALRAAGGSRG